MKNKQIAAEKILDDIYLSIKYFVYYSNMHRKTTVESFLKKYKYFYYQNEHLFFSQTPFTERTTDNKGYKWNPDTKYVDISYTYINGEPITSCRAICTYRRVFKYMIITKSGGGFWVSDMHHTKHLLKAFPTRKNILDKLLAEL